MSLVSTISASARVFLIKTSQFHLLYEELGRRRKLVQLQREARCNSADNVSEKVGCYLTCNCRQLCVIEVLCAYQKNRYLLCTKYLADWVQLVCLFLIKS